MYPEYAEIEGKEYKIDTSYKTALECFKVINDNTISNHERAMAIIYLLFDFIPEENEEIFLEKAKIYLQCGKTTEEQKKIQVDMDLVQDEKLIFSSILYDYKEDLSKEDMHFWKYIDLIYGLSEDCCLNRIRTIRTYDLSEIKDIKRRNRMKELQEKYALKKVKKQPTIREKENARRFINALNGEGV